MIGLSFDIIEFIMNVKVGLKLLYSYESSAVVSTIQSDFL